LHHYGKLSSEISESQKQQQNKYTKREVKYIAKDQAYREMLLEDFEGELPKGFDQMDKNGRTTSWLYLPWTTGLF